MLTTLILCLSNCTAPVPKADELGSLSGKYVQLCYEMHHLHTAYCPEIFAPVIMQCVTDIDRELPLRNSADFKNGMKFLHRKFATELPAQVDRKFAQRLSENSGDTPGTCRLMDEENRKQRYQILQSIKNLSNRTN